MEKKLKGVNLVGYSRAETGVGESCRLAANALYHGNINFGIIDFSTGNVSRMDDLSWKFKVINNPIYNTNIFHINADQMNVAYNELGKDFFRNAYNIGCWHWELPEFPDEWCDRFQIVDEVWAPSTFIYDSIAKKATVPVTKIPHCIDFKVNNRYKRRHFGLPENVFLFLTMYDIQSYQERKNPKAVIQAFRLASKDLNVPVGLVLKTNNTNADPKQIEELREETKGENIFIISQTLARNHIYSLMNVCDSYISLHRSEGFGLPLAEAMYLGKPVIGTNWSGNTEFMNKENSLAVDYKLIQLKGDYGPYKAHQEWADPDIGQASEYMKLLVRNPVLYHDYGNKGKVTIRSFHSPNAVGNIIYNRLNSLNLL